MTQWEVMRVAQLVFALSLMFGFFLGGLLIGWLRWGRPAKLESAAAAERSANPGPVLKHDLFSPVTENASFDDAVIVDGVIVDGTPTVDPFGPTGVRLPFTPAELGPATRATPFQRES